MLDTQLYNTEVYKYSHYTAEFCQRASIIQLVMQISDKGGNYRGNSLFPAEFDSLSKAWRPGCMWFYFFFLFNLKPSPINELISGWSVRLCWWKCAVRMTCYGQRGHLFGACSFDTTFMLRDAIEPTYCLRVSGTIFCPPPRYCTTSLRVGCPTDTCTPLAHLQITCKLNLVSSLNTEWKKKVTSHPFPPPPPISLAPWQPHDEEKRSCSSRSLSLMVRLLV